MKILKFFGIQPQYGPYYMDQKQDIDEVEGGSKGGFRTSNILGIEPIHDLQRNLYLVI